jgi:hypothetical protein
MDLNPIYKPQVGKLDFEGKKTHFVSGKFSLKSGNLISPHFDVSLSEII